MIEHDITEKSLFELWSKTIPRIPRNRFNTYSSLSGLIFGLIPGMFGPVPGLTVIMLSYSDMLACVYAGILGFIIAGYAIFTAGNPRFLLESWKHIDKRSGLPLLKLHLLVFIRLFIVVCSSLMITLGFSAAFRLWPSLSHHFSLSNRLVLFTQIVTLGLIGWTVTASAVQLKALIFNLYDLTLTQVKFLKIDQEITNRIPGV